MHLALSTGAIVALSSVGISVMVPALPPAQNPAISLNECSLHGLGVEVVPALMAEDPKFAQTCLQLWKDHPELFRRAS